MSSWNPRRWGIWHNEIALHHFPGQPGLQQPPPVEQYQPPLRQHFGQPSEESPPADADQANQLRIFIGRCYILAVVFVAISLLEWVLVAALVPSQDVFPLPGFICVALAFSFLVVLSFCTWAIADQVCGLILAVLFVETVAIGQVFLLPQRTIVHVLLAFSVSAPLLIVCYLLGAWAPLYWLPGGIALCMTVILMFTAATILLSLYIVKDQLIYQQVYLATIGIVTLVMSIYHAQIVHNRRYVLPMGHYLMCAVVIFMHFVFFFTAFYYCFWARKSS